MSVANSQGYLIKKLPEVSGVPCPCGLSMRLLTAADGAPLLVACHRDP
jgi:hypothetical protein